MKAINQKLMKAVFDKDQKQFSPLHQRSVQKTASEQKRQPDDSQLQAFRERLRENVVKTANEKVLAPANLRAPDPYSEYVRRADALDKTGQEPDASDIVLAGQAFQTLKIHGLRSQQLKSS